MSAAELEGQALPEPYYAEAGVTLYQGNARDIVPLLPRPAVIVTDPPYGIGYASGVKGRFRGVHIPGDATPALREWIVDHLVSEGIPGLVFAHWRTPTPTAAKAELVWSKGAGVGMGNLKLPWKPDVEHVHVFGRGFEGSRRSSILRHDALMGRDARRHHPVQKPLTLMLSLVAKCPDGVVLDPFAGAGTTLLAARVLGRPAVGIELDPQWCKVAAHRLSHLELEPVT